MRAQAFRKRGRINFGLKNYLSIMYDKAFGKGRSFFRTAYFLPAILSMLTVSLIFGQIFYRMIPVIGEKLHIEALQMNILADLPYRV